MKICRYKGQSVQSDVDARVFWVQSQKSDRYFIFMWNHAAHWIFSSTYTRSSSQCFSFTSRHCICKNSILNRTSDRHRMTHFRSLDPLSYVVITNIWWLSWESCWCNYSSSNNFEIQAWAYASGRQSQFSCTHAPSLFDNSVSIFPHVTTSFCSRLKLRHQQLLPRPPNQHQLHQR